MIRSTQERNDTAMTRSTLHIINGPNLNLLGSREPDIYGSDTLADIEARCNAHAPDLAIRFVQSNSEGALVDFVQAAHHDAEALIINPGAYTHTSIALRDALSAGPTPAIELHLSNTHAREKFRRHSFISPVVSGIICGFGAHGYLLAIDAVRNLIAGKSKRRSPR